MKKYDCTKTLDYIHEFNRKCMTEGSSYQREIAILPDTKAAEESIADLQRWSDSHPDGATPAEQAIIDAGFTIHEGGPSALFVMSDSIDKAITVKNGQIKMSNCTPEMLYLFTDLLREREEANERKENES